MTCRCARYHRCRLFLFFLPKANSLSFPFPFSPSPLRSLEVDPLNTTKGSGRALQAPPVGSGAKPQSTNDLVHILVKKCSSGGNNFFVDFPKNKRNFLHKNKLDIVRPVQCLTGRRPVRSFLLLGQSPPLPATKVGACATGAVGPQSVGVGEIVGVERGQSVRPWRQ